MHFRTSFYQISPNALLSQLQSQLREFREEKDYPTTLGGDVQSVCDCFQIKITVYSSTDYQLFQPADHSDLFLDAHLFIETPDNNFDSVIGIAVSSRFRNLSDNYPQSFLRMSSWNVRGATDIVKRNMIDYELNERKIFICGIQESHLWSHTLSSAHYNWILGKQSSLLNRASRGIGFLVHKSLSNLNINISFPSSNIGVLEMYFPSVSKPIYCVNIHKCNDNDNRGAIENGVLVLFNFSI
jgi:hypothetical protein